jgi:hypothetical protein
MHRFFEILPGAAAWFALLSLLVLSAQAPAFVVVFIVLYDLYWFLKVVYLFVHLHISFQDLRRNTKTDWLARVKQEDPKLLGRLWHLVVFPIYCEPYAVARESVRHLADSNYPADRILIVIAVEERGGLSDRETAERIEKEFGNTFGGFLVAHHPADIPGELPGKGSNETWAARAAQRELIDARRIPYEDVLVSVFDIDTRIGREYFGILTHAYATSPHPDRSSYQPTPLFTNNVYQVPLFARLIGFSATFWQLMQQGRPEQLVTFSSHSLPFKALVDVGFWHTDTVSEDSRIFFQCLIHYRGDWRTVPLVYPVYMDAVSGGSFFGALRNLYRQQRRWAWGAENFVYVADAFRHSPDMPSAMKRFWLTRIFDGFFAWSTSSFIIFFFGWFPNLLGNELFHTTVLSYNLPRLTGMLINLSSIGIMTSALLSIAILPRREPRAPWYTSAIYLLQWILMPLTFIIFGSLPALEAQTRLMLGGRFRLGFWKTPKAAGNTAHRTDA